MRYRMKRLFVSAVILMAVSTPLSAIGVSFSYFFPFYGELASPVAPFAIDDFGLSFNDYFGVSTGAMLYNVGGMLIKNTPLVMHGSGTTSFLSLNVPLYAKLTLPIGPVKLSVKGGGFAFYNFNLKLNREFDRAMAVYEGCDALTSDFLMDNNIGIGWRVGGEISVKVKDKISVILSVDYLSGFSKLNIRGSYYGGTNGGTVTKHDFAFPEASLDYTGLTVSVGVDYQL